LEENGNTWLQSVTGHPKRDLVYRRGLAGRTAGQEVSLSFGFLVYMGNPAVSADATLHLRCRLRRSRIMSEHDSVRLRSSRRSVDSGGVPPPSPPQPTAAAAAALNPHRRGPVTMASLTSPPALEEEEGDATFPERSCFYAPKYLRRPAPKISLKFRCFDRINGPGYPTRLLWNLRHS
jgi:hypothetical protein